MQNIIETLHSFLGDSLFKVLNGIVTIVIGFIIVKIVKFIVKRILTRLPINQTVATFINSIILVAIYLFYCLAILGAFGVDTSGVIALVGSVGVAVGLALKDSLSNIANGILLVSSKPFSIGDFVNINNTEGTVVAINMISTVLQTGDNKIVTIPNNQILANNIVNYNARTTRRLDLTVSVAYNSDLELVKDTILEILNADDRIFKDPAPSINLDKLNSSSLDFSVKVWLNSGDYHSVRFSVNEQIIKKFAQKNIEIPYDRIDVTMRNE